ncbi:hypothetical protein FNV43_RR04526 [Rhamnella rubrinervis]|uniref:C2H2-type domain-containing protein n=1 Tax=Rhamnella rubrinervis TaxID=2594499 RepID=A0A8K0HM35_9ROSA|nr:hypothetical protein FNV43_RR04526 [Rhamnella rubrinervis]
MDEEQEKQFAEDDNNRNQDQKQLKLKIINSSDGAAPGPKKQLEGNNQGVVRQQQHKEPRICDLCGKVFDSGKALGGHKRFHNEEARKCGMVIPTKLKMKKHKHTLVHNASDSISGALVVDGSSETSPEEKFRCNVCLKEFRSKKSLFGHMRSHPDRLWRGMQPPRGLVCHKIDSCSPPAADDKLPAAAARIRKSDELEYDDGDEYDDDEYQTEKGIDLIQSGVSSWCKTDKRGRQSIQRPDQAAAEKLVCLSAGDQSPKSEEGESLKKIKNKKILSYDSDDAYWLGEDRRYLELDVEKKQIRGFDDYDMSGVKRKMTTSSTKKDKYFSEKKPRKMSEESAVEKRPKTSFKCTSCGKSFKTFQALGGHRSSHNKYKNNPSSSTMDDESDLVVDEKRSAGAGLRSVPVVQVDEISDTIYHCCKICNEKFTSRKGLGGHVKCHSRRSSSSSRVIEDIQDSLLMATSEASTGKTSNQSASPGENSQSTGSRMLEFDLNEPYVMEDDEDGANDDDDQYI